MPTPSSPRPIPWFQLSICWKPTSDPRSRSSSYASTSPAPSRQSNASHIRTTSTPETFAARRIDSSAVRGSWDWHGSNVSGRRSLTAATAAIPASRRRCSTSCVTRARTSAPGSTRIRGNSMCDKASVIAVALLLMAAGASAQDNVIARARAVDSSGQRPQALTILANHLSSTPRDVDARLVYGLMLSWDKRYDEARAELQQVLTQTPEYKDARVALMNVEWWSGRTPQARDLAAQILTRDPGDPQARLMQQRLDARTRPWSVKTGYSVDAFNDGADSWHEFELSIARQMSRGSVIVRGTNAARFGYRDQLIEVEAYPRLRAGTYAFLSVGTATHRDLFPDYRAAVDLYQSLGGGVEVSGGYRRLQFLSPVDIYVGTATKYLGQWSMTEIVSCVPCDVSFSWSFHTERWRFS